MACLSPLRRCCVPIAVFALLCLAGCAVPLAPGYKIEKQSITVRFVPGSPPHLAIRAEYRLANVGNAPLDSIEVGLPGHKGFGRENLHVQVQGHAVAAAIARGEEVDEGESSSSEAWPVVWRIPFSPAWPRKQKRNLLITYELTAAIETHLRMYIGSRAFYLNDSGWFPDPLAPKSFLAKDLVRPSPADLHIVVPEGFHAMGTGELKGEQKANGEASFRFQMRKDDFDPFVIAGTYFEQQITTSGGTVVLWTFSPVSVPQAQALALQIAAARISFEAALGPLPRSMKAIYDVELPEDVTTTGRNHKDILDFFLPGVVYDWFLTSHKGFGGWFGNAMSEVVGNVALGFTWFGHMIHPRPGAWGLAQGLVAYTSELQDQRTSAGSSRNDNAVSSLHDYDDVRANTVEKPILSLTPNDSDDQLRIGGDKLALFFYALEDRCGQDNLNRALAHMISALRFQQYGYDDFRSAVEQECHQDLGGFFRSWLNEKGIPADFRAKYEPASPKQN